MKVGFIFECTPKGPDESIYPYVAKRLCEGLETETVTLVNKQRLLEEGPAAAKILLDTGGCSYVFIIWDRMPKWGGTGNCPNDIAILTKGLNDIGVPLASVFLCCISEMLESWIISDKRGFNNWIQSKTTRPLADFGDHASPAEQTAPKERIKRYLREHFNKQKFNDFIHSFEIVKELPDFARARNWNTSFNDFCTSVQSICPPVLTP